MSIRRLVVIVALAAGLLPPTGAARTDFVADVARTQPSPEVSCAACVVIDDSGHTLWARAPHAPRPNASTTKMATALVVVRSRDLSEEVQVSAAAAATGGGGLDLHPGDSYSVEELLYALLLSSSNDAAVALAEHVAGSHSAFVDEMNRLARRSGATATNFVTAHGLDVSGHYSSAHDLAVLGSAVVAHPALARIVATRSTVITGEDGTVEVENRNVLLDTYPGAIGIKTGYTALAGNVLVAAARQHDRTVVTVAMGSVDATLDATILLDYGFERLAETLLLDAGARVGVLVWSDGQSSAVVTARSVTGLADPAQVRVEFVPAEAGGPVAAGDRVGTVEVAAGDRLVGRVPAVATDTVEARSQSWPGSAVAAILRTAAAVTGFDDG